MRQSPSHQRIGDFVWSMCQALLSYPKLPVSLALKNLSRAALGQAPAIRVCEDALQVHC
jgi:hypothetical protein